MFDVDEMMGGPVYKAPPTVITTTQVVWDPDFHDAFSTFKPTPPTLVNHPLSPDHAESHAVVTPAVAVTAPPTVVPPAVAVAAPPTAAIVHAAPEEPRAEPPKPQSDTVTAPLPIAIRAVTRRRPSRRQRMVFEQRENPPSKATATMASATALSLSTARRSPKALDRRYKIRTRRARAARRTELARRTSSGSDAGASVASAASSAELVAAGNLPAADAPERPSSRAGSVGSEHSAVSDGSGTASIPSSAASVDEEPAARSAGPTGVAASAPPPAADAPERRFSTASDDGAVGAPRPRAATAFASRNTREAPMHIRESDADTVLPKTSMLSSKQQSLTPAAEMPGLELVTP